MVENNRNSDTMEQRRNARIRISPQVGYVILGKYGKVTDFGKGQALNVSHSGVLLQTQKPLNGAMVMLINIDNDDMDLKVKGSIVYSRMHETTGNFVTGINFFESRAQSIVL